MFYVLVSLTLLTAPVAQAPSKKPCSQMASKICNSLGFDAFFCQTYVRVARHADANQKRCRQLMNNNWANRLAGLQRLENNLKQMKTLSEDNPVQKQQFQQYQKKLARQTISGMLKSHARRKTRVNARACRMLAAQACKDLGPRSFYCGVFLAASKSRRSKPAKCYIILQNWNASQLANYAKREKFLAIMSSKARTRSERLQVLRIRQSQKRQILQYLQQ